MSILAIVKLHQSTYHLRLRLDAARGERRSRSIQSFRRRRLAFVDRLANRNAPYAPISGLLCSCAPFLTSANACDLSPVFNVVVFGHLNCFG